ncbi:hypothetical protein BJV78DRAFT_1162276 [Lactifluus subvellereus]|nr:hypothetical protein BJV78DRAFT_1162276 [Lactifluus subvellereus]
MGSAYMFSLQPTFTQGFILGQFSILALLAVVLKYLFFDTEHSQKVPVYAERDPPVLQPTLPSARIESESTEWLNTLLHQENVYRSKLRDDLQGVEGDEILRSRVEDYVNRMRPSGVLDRIQVHSVNLGVSAPQLSKARSRPVAGAGSLERSEFDLTYKENVSISLSTAYLFNYPTIGFARLPVSVTISLSVFSSHSTSLLGSRAKLADVPKLHELIDSQIRRALIQRGTLRIVLPFQ